MIKRSIDYQIIIRRALADARDYRLNHCRRTSRVNDVVIASEYEGAAHMIDSRQLITIIGSPSEFPVTDDELEEMLRQALREDAESIKPKGTLEDIQNEIARHNSEK